MYSGVLGGRTMALEYSEFWEVLMWDLGTELSSGLVWVIQAAGISQVIFYLYFLSR